MGSGISSTIGNVAEDAKFTITCSCCNDHAYRKYDISRKNIKRLHLGLGSSYVVMNNKMYRFDTMDSLHKFVHDLEEREEPLKCDGVSYIHK